MMNLPDFRFISKSIIQPSRNPSESSETWDLTPWDLALFPLHYIQKGLLFLKPTCPEATVDLLKTSLSRTLSHFTPLAGRLASNAHHETSTSFFIQYSYDQGAQFIHAACNRTIADIIHPLYVPPFVHSFFPLNSAFNYDGLSQPLLAVQVTELVDGLFIGCSINHVVADGASFWHFFNSWSEISRGVLEPISRPPVLNRWFPNSTNDDNPLSPIRLTFQPHEFTDKHYNPTRLHERIFHFSADSIASLKAKANTRQSNISSLQALLAHIWRCVTRVRNLESDQETRFRLPINNRHRLDPPLPENYFGNSIQVKAATARAGELMERGLGWAAWLLNQVVVSHNDEEVRSYVQLWLKNPRLARMSQHRFCDLAVMSSPRFSVYGNDFGWGRPVGVRSGVANKCDGNVTLYDGGGKGSVDVEICLSEQSLRALGDDLEFMGMVTVVPVP